MRNAPSLSHLTPQVRANYQADGASVYLQGAFVIEAEIDCVSTQTERNQRQQLQQLHTLEPDEAPFIVSEVRIA